MEYMEENVFVDNLNITLDMIEISVET